MAEAIPLIRNSGFKGYDNVIHPGTNGKMIEVCAAMGLANLDGFDGVTEANRRNHIAYKKALAGIPGVSVLEYDPAERNSHHYIVLERSEEDTSELQSLMRISYAVFCLKKKKQLNKYHTPIQQK